MGLSFFILLFQFTNKIPQGVFYLHVYVVGRLWDLKSQAEGRTGKHQSWALTAGESLSTPLHQAAFAGRGRLNPSGVSLHLSCALVASKYRCLFICLSMMCLEGGHVHGWKLTRGTRNVNRATSSCYMGRETKENMLAGQ